MLKHITKLANDLDRQGHCKLAELVDEWMEKYALPKDACEECWGSGEGSPIKKKDNYGNEVMLSTQCGACGGSGKKKQPVDTWEEETKENKPNPELLGRAGKSKLYEQLGAHDKDMMKMMNYNYYLIGTNNRGLTGILNYTANLADNVSTMIVYYASKLNTEIVDIDGKLEFTNNDMDKLYKDFNMKPGSIMRPSRSDIEDWLAHNHYIVRA